MKKSTKIKIVVYSVAFLLPILGVMNCPNVDIESLEVKGCVVDGFIPRLYAQAYYALIMTSAYLVIPFVVYVFVVSILTKTIVKYVAKEELLGLYENKINIFNKKIDKLWLWIFFVVGILLIAFSPNALVYVAGLVIAIGSIIGILLF